MFNDILAQGKLIDLLSEKPWRPFPPRSDRASWQALGQETTAWLFQRGEEALAGFPMLEASRFLAFTRAGDRQAYEQPYFKRRSLLMHAILAECVEDKGRFLDAVIDGLWCVCEETTWVLSAHNGSSHPGSRHEPLPDKNNPYIDLFAAQTAATLAYALYFLKDRLDMVSPLISRRVRQELEERVLRPFMARDDFWWMGMIRQDLNNWTPWIVSNVLDTMLMLWEDRQLLSDGIARALLMLERYLRVIPEDGGIDEGCAYWNMAGGSLLDCLELVYKKSYGRLDIYQDPKIQNIGAFPLHAHIDGVYYWNFNDCDARPKLDGERLYTYGLRTGNEALMALGSAIHHRGAWRSEDTPQMNRLLLSLFTQVPPLEEAPKPAFLALHDTGIFAYRPLGCHLAIKAGHNGESHNHNDLGSFLLYDRGQPLLIDIGNVVYTAQTFSDRRYELWNTRSKNHNVPLIGGVEQQAGEQYKAVAARADEGGVLLDLSRAYPVEAGLSGFTREMRLTEKGFELIDAIETDGEQDITWVFLFRDRPSLEQGKAMVGRLCLSFPEGLKAQVEELPVTDKRLTRNYPGSLFRLTLNWKTASSHTARFELIISRETPPKLFQNS